MSESGKTATDFSDQSNQQASEETKQEPSPLDSYWNLSILIGIISIGAILFIAADECRQCFNKKYVTNEVITDSHKSFWVFGKNLESGHLQEVYKVLEILGYQNKTNDTDWDLLWAHDYPFRTLYERLNNLKPHQKVNHFPGCGYITNKVKLATSNLKYIPPAFELPNDQQKLLDYSRRNPDKLFVQKNNNHRHIKIVQINDIDMKNPETFVQEYVDKPLLINGHRFDIGIYTVITSMDPLRIYIYNGDALLRFCPAKYHPFNPDVLDKYVVGDDYVPTWELPSLDYYYNELGFGMKESLNAYLRSKGQDPTIIWNQIEDAIRIVILEKEKEIVTVLQKFRSRRNFFEMMRFDFVIDENLKIYLLEANMSPNLSSAHFPPNRLLYQQVLFNVLGLIGIGEKIVKNTLKYRSKLEREIIVSDKQLAVFPEKCNDKLCRNSCVSTDCHLCRNCMSPTTREYLVEAFREHVNIGECKRVFPPPMTRENILSGIDVDNYSPENQLQYKWYQGKCILDPSWC